MLVSTTDYRQSTQIACEYTMQLQIITHGQKVKICLLEEIRQLYVICSTVTAFCGHDLLIFQM
jgi:hypothetical protein